MGHTLSGFYNVKGGNNRIATNYCDFSKSPTDIGYDTQYGFVDIKSSPVGFFVTRHSRWSTVATIPYENVYLNLGSGMNLTSGVFTVPKAGIYDFTFKGTGFEFGRSADYGHVYLQKNGEDVIMGTFTGSIRDYPILSVDATFQLGKGDTIAIRNGGVVNYSGRGSWIQFKGSLVEEDLVIS